MTDLDKLITDDEMEDLPEDDHEAFVIYEKRLAKKIQDSWDEDSSEYLARHYMSHIVAFIDVADLDIYVGRVPPPPGEHGF